MFFNSFLNALPGAVAQGLIWGLMSIGVYITYKILDIADLSVDGTLCTGGAVCAMMMIAGYNVWVSMLVATIAGMLAGMMTGVFHVFMGIPPILAGILTQLSLYSINLKIMGVANKGLPSRNYDVLVSMQNVKKMPITENTLFIVLLFNIAVIAVLYWFFGTELGCGIRATGSNRKMARAQGINTNMNRMIGLVLSNGIVGLSGALLTQYQGFADVSMGRGAIVVGLAAVIIGESLFGKLLKHNFALKLTQIALGGIVYYIVYQAVILMGIDPDLLKMLSALVVAVFLAIPYIKEEYFPKSYLNKGVKKCSK